MPSQTLASKQQAIVASSVGIHYVWREIDFAWFAAKSLIIFLLCIVSNIWYAKSQQQQQQPQQQQQQQQQHHHRHHHLPTTTTTTTTDHPPTPNTFPIKYYSKFSLTPYELNQNTQEVKKNAI